MAILSWLRSNKHFVKRNPADEFKMYTDEELARLKSSDAEFDEHAYREAVDLVLRKLDAR